MPVTLSTALSVVQKHEVPLAKPPKYHVAWHLQHQTWPNFASFPVVNFTNIVQHFLPIFFCKKYKHKLKSRDKLCKLLSFQKADFKMLIKLTPEVDD